jgi:hypothetical protein
VSNYNLESFPGYEGRIIAGPEVVNGTGQVLLKFFEDTDPDKGGAVYFWMDSGDVLELAVWLSSHAAEAARAYDREQL